MLEPHGASSVVFLAALLSLGLAADVFRTVPECEFPCINGECTVKYSSCTTEQNATSPTECLYVEVRCQCEPGWKGVQCTRDIGICGVETRLCGQQACIEENGKESCVPESAATFTGDGYALFYDYFAPRGVFDFFLEIRTTRCNSVLMFAQRVDGVDQEDFFALQLVDGKLRFSFDNGAGEVLVDYNPENLQLCNGEWHSIRGQKVNNRGFLQVDGMSSVTVTFQTTLNRKTNVDTGSPIVVGGIPPIALLANRSIPQTLLKSTGFVGCMRNVEFSTASKRSALFFSEASVLEQVRLDTCDPNPLVVTTTSSDSANPSPNATNSTDGSSTTERSTGDPSQATVATVDPGSTESVVNMVVLGLVSGVVAVLAISITVIGILVIVVCYQRRMAYQSRGKERTAGHLETASSTLNLPCYEVNRRTSACSQCDSNATDALEHSLPHSLSAGNLHQLYPVPRRTARAHVSALYTLPRPYEAPRESNIYYYPDLRAEQLVRTEGVGKGGEDGMTSEERRGSSEGEEEESSQIQEHIYTAASPLPATADLPPHERSPVAMRGGKQYSIVDPRLRRDSSKNGYSNATTTTTSKPTTAPRKKHKPMLAAKEAAVEGERMQQEAPPGYITLMTDSMDYMSLYTSATRRPSNTPQEQ